MTDNRVEKYGSKEVTLAAGEKISISNYGGGVAKIYLFKTFANYKDHYVLEQTLENDITILGPYTGSQKILIDADNSTVIYSAGTSPNYNYTSVSGPMAGYRNYIINGRMDHWQRGTSFSLTSSNAYTVDRYLSNRSGANLDIDQMDFTPGQTDVPGEPEFYTRVEATSSDNLWGIVQRVEGVRTLAGQQVTFSFYAKADASYTLRIALAQDFGTGGSSDVTLSDTSNTVTTSWQRYSFTTTLGSISGKTIGADNFISCQALINDSTTGILDLAMWQLEKGPVATEHEDRLNELRLCQRYCWQGKSVASGNAYLYASAGDANMYANGASFPVTMRKSPTMSIVTAPTYNNCSNFDLSASENGYAHRVDVTATGRYRAYNGVYRADAEL